MPVSCTAVGVGVFDVLGDHALGIEIGTVESDCGAHHLGKPVGLFVIERQNDVFELCIKLQCFAGGIVLVRVANRPTGNAFNMAFDPPTVEHAETWHTVKRRLHATGAGSFLRP